MKASYENAALGSENFDKWKSTSLLRDGRQVLDRRKDRANGFALLPLALSFRLSGWTGNGLAKVGRRLAADFGKTAHRKCLNSGLRLGILGVICLVLSFFLQNSYASAASITLTVPSSGLSVSVDPSKDSGFAKSANSSVTVKTDGHWGYELSVKAKDDNSLKNGSNKFTSISSSISESTFKSGSYNNQWGFLPSKLSGSANTNFVAGPTTSPTIIEKTSTSNDAPNPYTFAIGAKTDGTLPTGKYSNTFTFTAVANKVSYKITYDLQSGSWTGTSPQEGSTAGATIMLSSTKPSLSGYEFQGWCSTDVTSNKTTSPSCSGTTYNDGSLTYALSNGTNEVTVHAIWKMNAVTFDQVYSSAGKSQQGGYYKMQDMTSSICDAVSSTDPEQTAILIDARDDTIYTVAKLKDGKCWMAQDLKIVNRSISSSDSDMASGSFTIPASDLSTFNVGGSGYSLEPDNSAAYVDSTYGGYYTWYTATAGTGSSVSSDGSNASGSICPKGWKLPTSYASDSDFQKLVDAYGGNNSSGSSALRATPTPGFTFSGGVIYSDGSLFNQGSYGYYWSSTAYSSTVHSSTHAYYLDLYSSSANPSLSSSRVYGLSVRCLVR